MSTIKISEEKARGFEKKSELMVPACFGCYDANDIICKLYCARSCREKLENQAAKIRAKMEENSQDSFFSTDFKLRASCEEKTKNLMAKIEVAKIGEVKELLKEELKELLKARDKRDLVILAEESETLSKKPKDAIRVIVGSKKFAELHGLCLEIKNPKFFQDTFGERNCVGRLYQILPDGKPVGKAEQTVGFVKATARSSITNGHYQLKVLKQEENSLKNIVLTVKFCSRLTAVKNFDNFPILELEIYRHSAREHVKMEKGFKF